MDEQLRTAEGTYALCELLTEGKTKKVFGDLHDPTSVIVESKNDITAGDGAKHDVISGKAALATRTNANVMSLLRECGVPVAFREQLDNVRYRAALTHMIPLEVVCRREAHGSFLKRYPHIPKGTVFSKLVFELFLKTSGKTWRGRELLCDDPHAMLGGNAHGDFFDLYTVKEPFVQQKPFLSVPVGEVFDTTDPTIVDDMLEKIEKLARKTFLALEKQWQLLDRQLVDFKIEFGITTDGELVVSDVIDNDSWRLVHDDAYQDKQVYRDGGDLSEVAAKYRLVAELSDRFRVPVQSVIVWCGSAKDDHTPILKAIQDLSGVMEEGWTHEMRVRPVVCSIHKEPERGLRTLRQLQQEIPQSVIIAFVGMSNGAGPTLSAHTTLPVINVPASADRFPDDVWSSLRMPSNVPCMTVLGPHNAAEAALNILALSNPALYAQLQYKKEDRLENWVLL